MHKNKDYKGGYLTYYTVKGTLLVDTDWSRNIIRLINLASSFIFLPRVISVN